MKIADKLIWRETDDGLVIVDPALGKVRVLNGVGADIWKMVEAGKSVGEIEQELVVTYGISAELAATDVQNFLADLKSRQLLR
jgi:hypothetical protein